MPPSLSEIDSIYKDTISKLPLMEKIYHCEQLIDKAQHNLMRNKHNMNENLRTQLINIMEAAQQEIKLLEKR